MCVLLLRTLVCVLLLRTLTGVQEVAEEEELDKSQWGELESESESEEESEEEEEEKDDSGLVTPAEGSVLCWFLGRLGWGMLVLCFWCVCMNVWVTVCVCMLWVCVHECACTCVDVNAVGV